MNKAFSALLVAMICCITACANHPREQSFWMRSSSQNWPPPVQGYDRLIFFAIEENWHQLVKNAGGQAPRWGTVVVSFRVHTDGTVSNVDVLRNTEDNFAAGLCRNAIIASGPFKPMPPALAKTLDGDYRGLTLTFYYE